jgi:Lipid A 3-O-deacylase (PagL)
MKKHLLYLLFLFCFTKPFVVFSQQNFYNNYIECSVGGGYSVPNHPLFPNTSAVAFHAMAQWCGSSAPTRWGKYIGSPGYLLGVSAESLGNPAVLGNAFGIMPSLRYGAGHHLQVDFGLGAAYLDNTYSAFRNPQNTVLGSPVSFFGHLALAYRPILSLPFALALQVNHYSNGAVAQPNLGANVASISLQYRFFTLKNRLQDLANTAEKSSVSSTKRHYEYNILGSLGITERGLDGPKYYAYTVSADISTRFNTVHRVSAGAAYIFSASPYYFMLYSGASEEEAQAKAQRFLVYAGYELLLGYVGIVGEGGVYLNPHFAQHSIISTKLGANIYTYNILAKQQRLTPYFGVYVRGYFGEADFLEMAAGMRF